MKRQIAIYSVVLTNLVCRIAFATAIITDMKRQIAIYSVITTNLVCRITFASVIIINMTDYTMGNACGKALNSYCIGGNACGKSLNGYRIGSNAYIKMLDIHRRRKDSIRYCYRTLPLIQPYLIFYYLFSPITDL
jgi:hypothetical protein